MKPVYVRDHLPDIKVIPPGTTTPADVFRMPLLEDARGGQEGALVCTCSGTDEVEGGRLKVGFTRSYKDREQT